MDSKIKLSNSMYVLLEYIYTKFNTEYFSVEELLKDSYFNEIGKKHFYRILAFLVKTDCLVVKLGNKDKRKKLYKITDLGIEFSLGERKREPKSSKVLNKKGICDRCRRDKKLILFKNQFLCKDCLLVRQDCLRLEDYVYANSGPEW